ncbi:minor tail protein [Gordonia phage Crater]|nr:minor tail protein [Gordonia phage Crater]
MSGRLTGVYQLPGGGFPPRDSKLWVRVPTDREEGGKTVYAAPIMVPINPPTHPSAPGFYDSGLLGEGPYQIQKAIFGAKDYRSRWYDVVLTEGSHTVQELIEDYDPDLYTPPVVNQVAVLRDETRTARDEAVELVENVTTLAEDTIHYDSNGQVDYAIAGSVRTDYTWNADGTCHTETSRGLVKTWTYDGAGNPISSTVTEA